MIQEIRMGKDGDVGGCNSTYSTMLYIARTVI